MQFYSSIRCLLVFYFYVVEEYNLVWGFQALKFVEFILGLKRVGSNSVKVFMSVFNFCIAFDIGSEELENDAPVTKQAPKKSAAKASTNSKRKKSKESSESEDEDEDEDEEEDDNYSDESDDEQVNGEKEPKRQRGGKASSRGRGNGAKKASAEGKGSGRGRGRPPANKSPKPAAGKSGKRGRPRKS